MSGLNGDWYEALKGEFAKPYYRKLFATVNEEYKTRLIFPPAKDIFNAFHLTPLKDVKVVILGQDPYHNHGQAHGLCFSVQKGVEIPPSLVNIYKELNDESWMYDPGSWLSYKVGRAGSADVEYCSDGACPSGQFSQRDRLGRIYRCCDHGTEQPGSSDRLYFMGSTGTEEEADAEQSEASHTGGTASESAVCVQRILWKQTIQSDECIS